MRGGLARLNVTVLRGLLTLLRKLACAALSYNPLAVSLADRVLVAAHAAALGSQSKDIASSPYSPSGRYGTGAVTATGEAVVASRLPVSARRT